MDVDPQKTHKKRQAGSKVNKKKRRKFQEDEDTEKTSDPAKRNPKAFSFQAVNKTTRLVHRALDAQTRKHKVPDVDRTPIEPAPTLVAVVGPPKCGKTTLIRSLVKHFTKQNIKQVKGPVTVVTSKSKRCTFVECPNDICSMIDIAKVADLVLLLVDANFGFEMEIFEFLNIAQAHGLPRIMGVLTHLDMLKEGKAMNRTKRTLKHRFWTEVHQGAKLFYLSSLSFDDLYNSRDILNLARFISVMKFKILTWRQTHPYVVVDRIEDVTDPDTLHKKPRSERDVTFYGWLRGANLQQGSLVHIAGVGDYTCSDVALLPDPCPRPDQAKKKRRTLDQKERLFYGPMAGFGGLIFDKDAIYIETHEKHSKNEGDDLIDTLATQQTDTLDQQLLKSELSIFADSNVVKSEIFDNRRKAVFDDESEDEEDVSSDEEGVPSDEDEDGEEDVSSEYEDSDEDNEQEKELVEGAARWKIGLAKQAQENFKNRQRNVNNLYNVIYGEAADSSKEETTDSTRYSWDAPLSKIRWDTEENIESIRDCFVTGTWAEEEQYDDFEDLEADETADTEDEPEEDKKEQLTEEEEKSKYAKKKEKLKTLFDDDYDGGNYLNSLKEEVDTQTRLNNELFADQPNRELYEGYRAGQYIRIKIDTLPSEMIEFFDPLYPLVIGGIGSLEQQMGILQTRTKRHRWYPKILKNMDPIIVSLGWRRFQTQPVYSIQDHNMRQRMLKYTPEHMHCHASFYGPLAPPNTTFIATQGATNDKKSSFRIVATGVILGLDKTVDVVKKLKLTGTPYKIFKNTAFMKGMFSSALEVSKFEGALIKTVSGIRGQIKRALSAPAGAFRASFEDKIQISDIVFLRSWVNVEIPRLFVPVMNLLSEDKSWSGMRTVGELRRHNQLNIPVKKDSLYKEIERKEKVFRPLVVSKSLQKELPFKTKPKVEKKRKKELYMTKRAVVSEPGERKLTTLMQQLLTAQKHSDAKKMEKKKKEKQKLVAEQKVVEAKRAEAVKGRRKLYYQKNSKKDKMEA